MILAGVTSNEPDEGTGDGDFPDDIQDADIGMEDTSIFVRSERAGFGSGRIYEVVYEVRNRPERFRK